MADEQATSRTERAIARIDKVLHEAKLLGRAGEEFNFSQVQSLLSEAIRSLAPAGSGYLRDMERELRRKLPRDNLLCSPLQEERLKFLAGILRAMRAKFEAGNHEEHASPGGRTMAESLAGLPEAPDQLKTFLEYFLLRFNSLRRNRGEQEVAAHAVTVSDCSYWGCVLAEPKPNQVTVWTAGTAQEVEINVGNLAKEADVRADLLYMFFKNAKQVAESGSPENLAERILEEISPGPKREVTSKGASMPDARNVFVIHGRNMAARHAMFDFLRALGLNPLEWDEAVKHTGKGSPFTGEILDVLVSKAQAVVAMLTGDDLAHLRVEFQSDHEPDYEKNPTPQPRPNVLFEAGIAFGRHPEKTIIVQIGYVRPFSDTLGRHIIHFQGNPEDRTRLRDRLLTTQCDVKASGTDWLKTGDFAEALRLTKLSKP